jgi:integrase
MNKREEINTLILLCKEKMAAAGYTPANIKMHSDRWSKGIVPYMKERNLTYYTEGVGERYMETFKGLSKSTANGRRRSINILTEQLLYGTISSRIHDFCKYPLPNNDLSDYAKAFYEYCKGKNQAPLTITHHQRILSLFLQSIDLLGIKSLNSLTVKHILDFTSNGKQPNQRISSIRSFLKFIFEQYSIDLRCLISSLKKVQYKRHEPLPSVYTPDEIRSIESAINRQSPIGKRDYAVVILASRLGLRASDIASLSIQNIDKSNGAISLIQNKTKEPLVLPLLPEVEVAINDYLQNARPQCDINVIFISYNHPLRPLNNMSINAIVRRAIRQANIKVGKRHFGTHSLRHSLATSLLATGNNLPTISAILGHTSTETTMAYLRVDSENLRDYALEVSLVSEEFYNQKGGVFYAKRSL